MYLSFRCIGLSSLLKLPPDLALTTSLLSHLSFYLRTDFFLPLLYLLYHLYISIRALVTLCSPPSTLLQVDLFNNHITTIRKGDFDALWNLHYINTFMGYLSTVEEGSLRGLTHLEYLDLGYSFLKEVPEEVSYLPQLQVLALEYNHITEVRVEVIKPLVNLQWFSLVRNHVQAIPELDFLPHLTWLNLEANEVTALPVALFGNLLSPCKLWINDNPLSDVAARTLLPLPGGSEIRTNASLVIWARDDGENSKLLEKDWRVYDKELHDLDMNTMIHRCDQEPHDPDDAHPCHL
uniref:Uncharacterized protein n=1 Tax=Scylla olivacea TaxID=85551 RepID=A0A0P4W1N0_SCYOL